MLTGLTESTEHPISCCGQIFGRPKQEGTEGRFVRARARPSAGVSPI